MKHSLARKCNDEFAQIVYTKDVPISHTILRDTDTNYNLIALHDLLRL